MAETKNREVSGGSAPSSPLEDLGLGIPEILLPRQGIDLLKWAVVACDQFTQDGDYWEKAGRIAGDAPSTLKLIFPEFYLEADPLSREERIGAIHRSMADYLAQGIFAPPRRGWVYLERSTPFHKIRRGLVAAVDLERYQWAAGAKSLIRATEGTLKERLPPRMDIRRGAPLESPHILLLLDDEGDTLFPALTGMARRMEPAYRSPLMLDSGEVSGWFLDGEAQWNLVGDKLAELRRRAETRYGGDEGDPFLYAVGDGNHSLAAAKGIWEEYKAAHAGEADLMEHPARWALVEMENLYDPGLSFEPIHRVVFNAHADRLLDLLSWLPGAASYPVEGLGKLRELVKGPGPGQRLGFVSGDRCLVFETQIPGLATVSLQPLLDNFIAGAEGFGVSPPPSIEGPGVSPPSIDYIHGEEELIRLAAGGHGSRPAAGILLPPIRKEGLFETIARSGPLPRKSFSMGKAREKRFYLECRRLFNRRLFNQEPLENLTV
ncbi:MAG: DUF1015 domain-containing protein [Treponema sp.]|jgi:hypothetical protein|nr:DUF1015 domain-containing protein [Treponema sp.]